MLKIPYGISDYKELKTEGYYYVDKTMYLEKLEDVGKKLVYLRPGRFGKSLFTSMMYYYYDVNSKDEFDNLFKDTYIWNNPTINKNNYYILKFDFSGISEKDKKKAELEFLFKDKVLQGVSLFNNCYNTDITININNTAASMIGNFFVQFDSLKLEHKLYIIIDEYDNFTNAILEGEGKIFKEVAGNNGFVKNFYSTIKEYCKYGIVDRVFITGICPITLDSMTTGFNISTDLSIDVRFNEMIGLTHDEVNALIKDVEKDKQEEIFDLMLKNYDGYLFSKKSDTRVFNATLVMYFLKNYYDFNEIPEVLIDNNIAFNYGKVGNLLRLQNNEYYEEILDTILKTGTIEGKLMTKFNLEEDFTKNDFISLLYYFGYLTVHKQDEFDDYVTFRVPNKVMNDLYYNYFVKLLRDIDLKIDDTILKDAVNEMSNIGKIDIITKYVEEILTFSDNRIFLKFDEKYIGIIYFTLLKNIKRFSTYQEYPLNGGFADLMVFRNTDMCKCNIMIELKYIKKKEFNNKLFKLKRKEGLEQLLSYSSDDRIDKTNLKRYLVIFVGHELKLLEEV